MWLTAATVSQLGDVVLGFAVGWMAAAHGGAGAGLVLAAGGLPAALLLLLGGTVADRFGARRVMIAGDATMLVVAAVLACVVVEVGTPLGLLVVASVVRGVVSAFYAPADGSMPRRLVADGQLTRALALRQGTRQTVLLFGAPVGGLLVTAGGLGGVALFDAGTFLAVLIVLVLLRPRYAPPSSARDGSLWREAVDGVDVVRRTPGLLAALGLLGGAAAFLLPTMSLVLPLLARDAGWSSLWTGVVVGAQGAGIVAVTLVVARRGGVRRPGVVASYGLAVAALGQAGLALGAGGGHGGAQLAVVAATATGAGSGLFTAHLAPVVLGSAPRTHLARVQALVGLVQVLAVTVTQPVLGTLASVTSPVVAATVCAVGLLVCAVSGLTRLRLPPLDEDDRPRPDRLTPDQVEGAQ